MAQKTLLNTIQTAAAEMSLEVPSQITSILSSNDPNLIKLRFLLGACLEDLINEYDWQFLQISTSFNTVINQGAYNFPSDYVRSISGTFFDSSNRWPLTIVTPIQWEIIKIWNITASPFERLRVFGNQLQLFPVPTAVYTFVYDYISSNCIQNSNTGVAQSTFLNDSDIILFDSRLVINLLKLKYIGSVGNDTTVALSEYLRTLEMKKGQDKPAMQLSFLPKIPHCINSSNLPDGNFTGGTL